MINKKDKNVLSNQIKLKKFDQNIKEKCSKNVSGNSYKVMERHH